MGIVCYDGVLLAEQPSKVSHDLSQVLGSSEVCQGYRDVLAHPRGQSRGPSIGCVINVLYAKAGIYHIWRDLDWVTRERQRPVSRWGTLRGESARLEVDADEPHFNG